IKKFRKIVVRILVGIILLLLLLGILLTLPSVQTYIGGIVTKELRESTGADINVEKVAISVFGGVKLRGVLIKDHHQDTLIYTKSIQTKNLNINMLNEVDLIYGDLKADELTFYLTAYKEEEKSNINIFPEQFENDNPK